MDEREAAESRKTTGVTGPYKREDGKRRIRSYDIAKGITILLVIVGHQVKMDHTVKTLIFSFHMPLFFLANAAFIGSSYDVRKTFCRSLRTLLLPYAVVCALQVLLKGLLTPEQTIAAILQQVRTAMFGMSFAGNILRDCGSVSLVWFVACLFVARNLYVVCRRATIGFGRPVQYGVPIVLCIAGWWLGEQGLFLPWSADVALFAQVFMLVGDEVRRHGLLERKPHGLTVAVVVTAWVALALAGFQIEMALRKYPGFILCIVTACAGSLGVFWASERIDAAGESGTNAYASNLAELLAWLGQNSLVVLAIHCLRRLCFSWTTGTTSIYPNAGWVANACLEVLFCVAACYAHDRAARGRRRRRS